MTDAGPGGRPAAGSVGAGPDLAAFERIARGRFTCRAFLPRPVPRATIDHLLALAQRAANWCNTQSWQVIVTEGAATRRFVEAIYAQAAGGAVAPHSDFAFPKPYVGIYDQRRKSVGKALYAAAGVARDDGAARRSQVLRNFQLFGAPHVALITAEEDLGPYGVLDCGLYIQQFLLAAQAMGLGAAAQAALAQHSPLIRDHFSLPDNRRVLCGIAFGWPDPDDPVNQFRTERAPLSEVVDYRDH